MFIDQGLLLLLFNKALQLVSCVKKVFSEC